MDNAYLDEDDNVIECSFDEYLIYERENLDRTRRIVGKNSVYIENKKIFVSTVFLGINHRFGNGPKLWFETMIFGGINDQWQDRYTTYREASEGHLKILDAVRQNKKLEY